MADVDHDLVSFDDGYIPGGNPGPTKMAVNRNKAAKSFLSVFDDIVNSDWYDRTYSYAMKKGRPWGVYVTKLEVFDIALKPEELFAEEPERAIALEFTRRLIYEKAGGLDLRMIEISGGKSCISPTLSPSALARDLEKVHGTVVWCLSSSFSSSVEYHIDYAELYRYETNIIHPPLIAGTCHVSPIAEGDMKGGDFMANFGGLDHYRLFGYKGCLRDREELSRDTSEGDWISVKYKRGRGIVHDGEMPHLSTPVTLIPQDTRRVILGFNCFSETVGECCHRAPEHSDAFNRTVKLYQALGRASGAPKRTPEGPASDKYGSQSSPCPSATMDPFSESSKGKACVTCDSSINTTARRFKVSDIMREPALAKLLILAARKIKQSQSYGKRVQSPGDSDTWRTLSESPGSCNDNDT